MEKVTQLITRLQQICTTLGETAMTENAVLWNKLSTIVVVGGQVRGRLGAGERLSSRHAATACDLASSHCARRARARVRCWRPSWGATSCLEARAS